MRLRRLRVADLRNHRSSALDCAGRFTVLTGDNGSGKTSLLEAIALCAWTKSFVPPPANADAQLVRRGATGYRVEGEFVADSGVAMTIVVVYDGTVRRLTIDGQSVPSFAKHIGTVPIVVLAPDTRAITIGAPEERRRFVDEVLAQGRGGYAEALSQFRRALKQRNAILLDMKRHGGPSASLDAFTDTFVIAAARVCRYRAEFLSEFTAYLREAHDRFASSMEAIDLAYLPALDMPAARSEDWSAAIQDALASHRDEERGRGVTVVGPHRDDVAFLLNGVEARSGASQGQHKTLLVALKYAEWRYLTDIRQERPIVLLDDLFSELDAGRARRFVEALCDCGQVFISTVERGEDTCVHDIFDAGRDSEVVVENGAVLDA
jgi:DNA replication and repair protein RecF